VEDALDGNPSIAADLVAFFEARFDPDAFGADEAGSEAREAAQQEIAERITNALDDVSSLDQDRIVRSFLAVMKATLRTNFYQDGAAASETAVSEAAGGEAADAGDSGADEATTHE